MYDINTEKSKLLSDRVHNFNRRYQRYGMTTANKSLYDKIRNEILEMAYYIPQVRNDLYEEDASDFVLYLMDKIFSIVTSYREDATDFILYLTMVLENKVRTFYRNRRNSEKKEESAVAAQVPFEVRCSPCFTSGETVSENSSSAKSRTDLIRKIRFISYYNPTMQKRMFVFLLSLSPFLPLNIIQDVCSALNIDFDQTLQITDYLASTNQYISDNVDFLQTRRNYYYRYGIELETELSIKNFFEDKKDVEKYKDKVEKTRKSLNFKNDQLNGFSTKVSQRILSDLLNMPKGTISCSIFYTKNLFCWLLNPDSIKPCSDTIGIGVNLIKKIKNGSWENAKLDRSKTIFPLQAYNIAIERKE